MLTDRTEEAVRPLDGHHVPGAGDLVRQATLKTSWKDRVRLAIPNLLSRHVFELPLNQAVEAPERVMSTALTMAFLNYMNLI